MWYTTILCLFIRNIRFVKLRMMQFRYSKTLNVKILIEIPSLENYIPLLYIIIGPNWTP